MIWLGRKQSKENVKLNEHGVLQLGKLVGDIHFVVTSGKRNKLKLKDAKAFAESETFAGSSDWRLPALPELKTLLYTERILNASGKKAWIHPIFDDGLGHYYWTTTTCDQLSIIEDRYQKKICQQGKEATWLVHFNINAIFWFHTNQERPHTWLVQNVE